MSYKAILFDLDGTLIDSSYDIATTCNKVAVAHGYKPLPLDELRPLVGRGSRGIMAHIANLEPNDPKVMQLREHVLEVYDYTGYANTVVYPDIVPVLQALHRAKIIWGIVTSKPRYHSEQIIKKETVMQSYSVLIGCDDVRNIKPDPESLNKALSLLNLHADECLYVGDNRVDILAAQRVNMASLGVGYGYCDKQDHPALFDPDYYAETPFDCAVLIRSLLAKQLTLA